MKKKNTKATSRPPVEKPKRPRVERPAPVRPRSDRPAWAAWWPLDCPLPGSAGWDALPWPTNVPVLTREDLVKQHVIPLGRPPYALDGWLEVTFGEDGPVAAVARIALDGVVSTRLGRQAAAWEYLLEKGIKKADAVSAWKEAMELLGYDMSHPAKPAKPQPAVPVADYEQYFPD